MPEKPGDVWPCLTQPFAARTNFYNHFASMTVFPPLTQTDCCCTASVLLGTFPPAHDCIAHLRNVPEHSYNVFKQPYQILELLYQHPSPRGCPATCRPVATTCTCLWGDSAWGLCICHLAEHACREEKLDTYPQRAGCMCCQ